ncbi:hypothetical protein O181_107246 [Austropuccinia psidii MF-1]|uniref:Uncharacterized protein n=1 Tax=Austropuccinia psidii MF-1 TaxID=1389203 RepID=A0A9Q3PNY5_9BASI|nr:hypothetical protein [Austropuccinia psidii MF-1]
MLANKHTRNACLLSDPSNQDSLTRTPLWSRMMKAFPSRNGHRDPKQAGGNNFGQLAQSPQVSIFPPPPLLGHHPMVTSLLEQRKVIIWPMKDGDGKRTFELGPIVTHEIQMPNFPHKQTPRQPTPEPSQMDEPPIPGLVPSSKPHEDIPTCEPESEVAPKQSMEEAFAFPNTPHSVITIDNMPVGSLPPSAPKNPTNSSPHSHNDACQEFTDLRPTLMIP